MDEEKHENGREEESAADSLGNGQRKESKLYQKMTPFRAAALYVNIPFTLLATTIVGYLIGAFIESRVPAGGAFIAVFSMLGVAAGFREIILLLKRHNK